MVVFASGIVDEDSVVSPVRSQYCLVPVLFGGWVLGVEPGRWVGWQSLAHCWVLRDHMIFSGPLRLSRVVCGVVVVLVGVVFGC